MLSCCSIRSWCFLWIRCVLWLVGFGVVMVEECSCFMVDV